MFKAATRLAWTSGFIDEKNSRTITFFVNFEKKDIIHLNKSHIQLDFHLSSGILPY